jgi:hypothetical protein
MRGAGHFIINRSKKTLFEQVTTIRDVEKIRFGDHQL